VLGAVPTRPFAGVTGRRLLELAAERRFDATLEFARAALDRAAGRDPGRLHIFDRHWMTVLSLLPRDRWDTWDEVPPTTLCWIDLDATVKRLSARGDRVDAQATREHAFYLARYTALAERFRCPVLRTDLLSEDESTARLVAWAESVGAVEVQPDACPKTFES
jgi:hypothetical protein